MLQATITHIPPKGSWLQARPRKYEVALPTSWSEVAPNLRRDFWKFALAGNFLEIARIASRIPKAVWFALDAESKAAMVSVVREFATAKPDCANLPFAALRCDGRDYYFPKPNGSNITAMEFAIADEYYNKVAAGDTKVLPLLVSTICREAHPDNAEAMRRDDVRVPIYSRTEVEARAAIIKDAQPAMQFSALLYWAGMKQLVATLYGEWLFDAPEQPEEGEPEPQPNEAPVQSPQPNFGWWGSFLTVAESGVFGNVEQVHHTAFHNVCVWMVKQEVKRQQIANQKQPAAHDEL
jgi:hypothetical protein